MKKLILIVSVFAGLVLSGCVITSETTSSRVVYHPNPTFSDLDNYGNWEDVPGYGTVWKPFDEDNWQPYADGQWVWTDQGWMWDSNEPYGWIVYHYGYWQFTDFDGWFWVPSYDWAPARVRWYRANGYVGWAPAPPPAMGPGVMYDNNYARRVWVVVPEQNFAGQNEVKYRNRDYVPDAQVLRSSDGGRAPELRDIERVSNRTINVVRPTREQVNEGNRQLTRVRVQPNTPASPSTIRTQPINPGTPANNTPPVVNPRKPVVNQPEINDRRPVNNGVQRQQEEKKPANTINNSQPDLKGRAQDNERNNNSVQKANPNQHSAVRNNAKKKNPANKKPAVKKQAPDNKAKDKNDNSDKKDEKQDKPVERR